MGNTRVVIETALGEIVAEIFEDRAPITATNFLRYLCLLYTSPSPRDRTRSRMPSSA